MIKILGKEYDVNITELDLSNKNLYYIPNKINQLTKLQDLILEYTKIKSCNLVN